MAKPKPTDPAVLQEPAFLPEVTMGADGSPKYRLLTPDKILGTRIKTPEDLYLYGGKYSHNMINMFANTPGERRWYIEKVRPALRFHYRRFGLKVPEWLEGNAGYDDLTPETHQTLFGSDPLHVQEFKTWGESFDSKR